MAASVVLNLRNLDRFKRELRGGRSREVRGALDEWGRLYADFTKRRFVKFSRGGGNWRQLAQSTIEAKRRRGAANPTRILVDTGLLLGELEPRVGGFSGVRSTKRGMQLRLDMSAMSSSYARGNTTGDVAGYHNTGGGRLPRRQIFIQPTKELRRKMAQAMQRAIRAWYKRTRV